MASWGNTNYANNAPTYAVYGIQGGTSVNDCAGVGVANNFANVVWGVPADQVTAAGHNGHAGWNKVVFGTGPVASVKIAGGGTGYSNGDLLKVSGGTTNASAVLTTNTTGGITSLTFSTYGGGFANVSGATIAVSNSTGGATLGSNATFTLALGGRAGRKFYETLIATGHLAANGAGSEFSNLP